MGAEVNGKLIHQGKDELKKANKVLAENTADQAGEKVD